MASAADARQNHLLAALPDNEWLRWQPQLEPVEMPLGKALYESGRRLTHVYFPTTSIVSLLYVMEDGASGEIAGASAAEGVARVDPRVRVAPGQRVVFAVDVDRLHLFDAHTGDALPAAG